MPSWGSTEQTKIDNLRDMLYARQTPSVFELLLVKWPSPDGDIYYSVTRPDEIADPVFPYSPVEARIIPEASPAWFLPVASDSTIGDEEITVQMWDGDGEVSQLIVDHGEGVRCRLYYWFPDEELALPYWEGHLRSDGEASRDRVTIKVVQGIRASETDLPNRGHYDYCSALFGGLFATQAEIDEHDCNYNKQISGGTIGNNNPSTGLPWTFCDRRDTSSCTARAVDQLYHLSHKTISATVINNQTQGNNLFSISQGNENNLKEPVTVIMGTRRKYGMSLLNFRRDLNNNHPDQGWFQGIYEACEGPISQIGSPKVTVGGVTQNVNFFHYAQTLGAKGQPAISDLTTHGYSGTAIFRYAFGWVNPAKVDANECSASAMITGLNNIRVYSNTSTYTSIYTNNRAWQLLHILCNKRWGYGLDYASVDIQSFIDAATWCAQAVTYTDPDGTDWIHVRAQSDVELVGKKLQEQIEDMCSAGRLSRPFWFNGKVHIMPLAALDSGDLAACPVFSDIISDGNPNIVHEEDGGSTLRVIERTSSATLTNEIKVVFDDIYNDYLERPLRPLQDVDAILAAGRVQGTVGQKINSKEIKPLGVVHEAHAVKLGWAALDLGEFDDGGLQNNCRIAMTIWFIDALDLHQEKVIKVESDLLTKYGFEYFRVKKMTRRNDLHVEIEAQAYNVTYMDAFETDYVTPPPTVCSIDADCPAGYECIDGVCVRILIEPVCRLDFGTLSYADGALTIPIEPC